MNSINRRKILVVLLFVFIFSLSAMVCAQNKTSVFASDTKTLSEVTYTMENGASIYNNQNRLGVRFGAYMSEADYTALKNNVGENKAYKSLSFGVVIAPASYEDVENGGYGKLNEENLFGSQTKTAIYDWATWNNETGAWEYPTSDKIRVINIETGSLKIAGTKASHSGSITNILKMNLLNEFKGVAYVRAEKIDGSFEYKFATESDNERNVVYVAQLRQQAIKEEISELDEIDDAEEIATLNTESTTLGNTYITNDVKATDATYTVEHYYAKPDKSGHFLYETTTKTGKINATLSADSASGSIITGVDFDEENENNASSPVIFAQDKSTVKVYYDVTYGADADETEKVYDISLTEDYEVDEGITAVYSADMSKISNTDGKIANKTIVDMGKGERDLYVLTENGFETYSTIMATHVIKTGEEFKTYLDSYSTGDANMTDSHYVVLNDNIDLSSMTLTGKNKSTTRFYGEFNGLGYSILGVKVTANSGGVFGALQKSELKNFAIDIVVTGTSSDTETGETAALAGHMYPGAKISNVYANVVFDYTTSSSKVQGLVRSASNGTVKNVIANVKFDNVLLTNMPVFGDTSADVTPVIENSYAIGNASDFSGYDCGTVYEDFDSFYSANVDNITTANGFNKYWKLEDNNLCFGDIVIQNYFRAETYLYDADNPTTYTTKNNGDAITDGNIVTTYWGQKSSVEINVAEILGANPTKVILGGNDIEISEGKISISTADYIVGHYPMTIIGEETMISLMLELVSHDINTADELVQFLVSYNGYKNDHNKTYYAVLSADIDVKDKTVTPKQTIGQSSSTIYRGIFDGHGHTVKNVTVNNNALFGRLQKGTFYAAIRNVAFVDIAGTSSGILTATSYGPSVVQNVYVKGTMNSKTGNGGVVTDVQTANTAQTVTNCIFDVTYQGNWNGTQTSYTLNGDADTLATTISKVYALGNAQYVQYGSEETPYTKGAFAQAVAGGTIALDAANGFNANWKVVTENGTTTVYFGNNVVDTYTATAE